MNVDHIQMNRRRFIATAVSGVSSLAVSNKIAAQIGASDRSLFGQPILGVRVGCPVANPNSWGDTWVAAWDDDDALYTRSDDTGGFYWKGGVLGLLPELTPNQKG